jgi:hypothetical protein
MTILLAALLCFQDSVTKDEVVRLTKEGVKEEEILKKIEKVKFKLSVDEIVELKKAGVSEKVIARMIEGPREAKVTNLAHKPITLRLNGTSLDIGLGGETINPGATVQIGASGEYTVTVNGRPTICRVKTPATLTFRGCDLEEFEVVTLFIEDARGSDTCLVESRVKR